MATGPRFNPLDTRAIGANVADALLKRPAEPLGEIERFIGAGIYAIYYTGELSIYDAVAKKNRNGAFGCPIYTGKAIPAGAQTGGVLVDECTGTALFNRLAEHAESVRAATNLDLESFFARYLVVDDVWVPLAEALLITRFAPVWNSLLRGFGNHDAGTGRHAGKRPLWDSLHPGRLWAAKCQARDETAEQLGEQIMTYLRAAADLSELLEPDSGDGSNSAK